MKKHKRRRLRKERVAMLFSALGLVLFVVLILIATSTSSKAENEDVVPLQEVQTYYEIDLPMDLQDTVYDCSRMFDIPPSLILAVMYRESSYNPDSRNGASTCYGLMQVHTVNFDKCYERLGFLNVDDIKNEPKDNIIAGSFLLSELVAKYDDYHMALMAYNCGEAGAKRLWSEGCFESRYSNNVIETMNNLDYYGNVEGGEGYVGMMKLMCDY